MLAKSAMAATFIFLFSNIFSGWPLQIRFSVDALNYWYVAIILVATPAYMAWYLYGFQNRVIKLSSVIPAAFSVIALLPGFITLVVAPRFGGASWEKLDEKYIGPYAYRLYQTNCGATCHFGLALRKERDLPVGLKVIWELWSGGRDIQVAGLMLENQTAVAVYADNQVLFLYVP